MNDIISNLTKLSSEFINCNIDLIMMGLLILIVVGFIYITIALALLVIDFVRCSKKSNTNIQE